MEIDTGWFVFLVSHRPSPVVKAHLFTANNPLCWFWKRGKIKWMNDTKHTGSHWKMCKCETERNVLLRELAFYFEIGINRVMKLWSQTVWHSLVCEPSVLFGTDQCLQNSELCIACLPLKKTTERIHHKMVLLIFPKWWQNEQMFFWKTYFVVSPSSNCCEGLKCNHPPLSVLHFSNSLQWTLWRTALLHNMALSGSQSASSVCDLLTCIKIGQSVRARERDHMTEPNTRMTGLAPSVFVIMTHAW